MRGVRKYEGAISIEGMRCLYGNQLRSKGARHSWYEDLVHGAFLCVARVYFLIVVGYRGVVPTAEGRLLGYNKSREGS